MTACRSYTVARAAERSFRMDRLREPSPVPVAYVRPVSDRRGGPIGWRLKPLFTMQGSASKIWPTAAEAIASTKLMTLGQAKAAIAATAHES
jgi:hypothetical protein